MKKEFKNWILDINNIDADEVDYIDYDIFDDIYADLGYRYEMDNLLLAININCTSDLIDFLITE